MLETILHQRRAGLSLLGFAPRSATDKSTVGIITTPLAVGARVDTIAFQPTWISKRPTDVRTKGDSLAVSARRARELDPRSLLWALPTQRVRGVDRIGHGGD